MSQLEDEIKLRCWNRNLTLIPQHHPMRELLLLYPLIIFLKSAVMPETQQKARPIMHFNLHTLIRWELDVVIACLFMRRDRTDKGDDPLVTPFHPDINITRRAMQAIGIQLRISLSFQDTGPESLLPEPLRNLNSSFIQPHIRLLQLLALRHPLQKQVPADTHIRRSQSLNTIKENAHQGLLLGDSI